MTTPILLYIIVAALILSVLYVVAKIHLPERVFNALVTTVITAIVTTVFVGSCAFRLGTACGQFDAAMPLQKCLSNPRG